jgi:hypothetical protein
VREIINLAPGAIDAGQTGISSSISAELTNFLSRARDGQFLFPGRRSNST